MRRFPFFKQLDAMDCGPSCLRMISKHYGKSFSLQTIRERCFLTREGVSFLGISDAAESIGMRSVGARVSFGQLAGEVPLPAIVHWKEEHFVVVYAIGRGKVRVADPAFGLINYPIREFLNGWCGTEDEFKAKGLALIVEPTPDFRNMVQQALQKPFDLDFKAAGIDVAFIALHGSYGEDGRNRAFLIPAAFLIQGAVFSPRHSPWTRLSRNCVLLMPALL